MSDDLTATLWPGPAERRRGPRPRLSAAAITAVAVAVADAEGLDAVSMQRVAADLGFTKMALYRHFPGKPELLGAMLDTAFGPPPAPAEDRWRERLRGWALAVAAVFARHPWTVELALGVRVYGPHETAWIEAGLAALDGTGIDGAAALDALVLLSGHVRSVVAQTRGGPADLEAATGAAMAAVLDEHRATYPRTRAAFAAARREGETGRALEFGVDRILDGLARYAEG
jgi:AcrR family transcriptional regulator